MNVISVSVCREVLAPFREFWYPCLGISILYTMDPVSNLYCVLYTSYKAWKQVSVAGLFRPPRVNLYCVSIENGIAPARNSPG